MNNLTCEFDFRSSDPEVSFTSLVKSSEPNVPTSCQEPSSDVEQLAEPLNGYAKNANEMPLEHTPQTHVGKR